MKIQFIKSATRADEYPKTRLPKIAFAGRSNVGKSSLINDLVGKKRLAWTSATPGRTQVINFFNVNGKWIFVDLPGYGFAKAPKRIRAKWGPMIEEFLKEDDNLSLVVMIVDTRREPTQLDLLMKHWLEEYEIPHQLIATKVDKLSSRQLPKSLLRIEEVFNCGVIPYSAATGTGRKKLWQTLERI